ncbi:MAG: iron-sulfur cluster repair di-iron protein [Flavobacteriales bacterium]|nr:iron-sulfur cluster repair di-iron protein [Flavobacteriales bacterium]
MEATVAPTIGEMVAENYRTAPVFKKYSIDFCCKGGRTIEDACAAKGIDPQPLLADLEAAISVNDDSNVDYTTWKLDRLVNHIEDIHHSYVVEATYQLKPFLDKVAKVHGEGHPYLIDLRNMFFKSAGNLAQHMKKEELILFPFIKKMQMAKDAGEAMQQPSFNTVENPIAMMKAEHEEEGERFEAMSMLSDGFNPPEYACNTWRVTYSLLKEFQDDLFQHIHLENNILFPKALVMEAGFGTVLRNY